MIIDSHCHAGTGDGLTGPWDTRASLGRYLRRAAEAGIDRSIVFAPFNSSYREANRATARLVARHPDQLLGYACLHAAGDKGHIAVALEEAVRLGLRGIKVHRHDAPLSREIAEGAGRHGFPVLYDVTGEVRHAALLAQEFPHVRWIIPHLGSFSDDWWAQRTTIDLLVRHHNVYADTSGVRRFDLLEEAAARAPHKLIFGSDGPELHPGLELAKVRELGLDGSTEARICGGTIRRLLRPGAPVVLPGGHARSEQRLTRYDAE